MRCGLTDRGTEYCGVQENHPYQLFMYLNGIDHSRTKARHPQTNGFTERLNQTILDEFYKVAFRKSVYTSLEQIQADLDAFMNTYNTPNAPIRDGTATGGLPCKRSWRGWSCAETTSAKMRKEVLLMRLNRGTGRHIVNANPDYRRGGVKIIAVARNGRIDFTIRRRCDLVG